MAGTRDTIRVNNAVVAPKRGVGLTIFNPLTKLRDEAFTDAIYRPIKTGGEYAGELFAPPADLVACTLVALQTLTKSAGIFGPATSARLPIARLRSSTWMTTGAVASAGLATS